MASDKFIAIGVGQGDAFYLERSGVKILVDGGRAESKFSNQFYNVTGTTELDIAVCTHADADHINGLIGLFKNNVNVSELWVPGTWSSRLQDLLTDPLSFFEELEDNIESLEYCESDSLEGLDTYHEYYLRKRDKKPESPSETNETDIQIIESALEEFRDFGKSYIPYRNSRIYRHIFKEQHRRNLFFDAIDTAKKIKELAILAFHSGTKIRWFEFNEQERPGGGEAFLRPVNSSEILNISKRVSVLEYLYLSKVNKQSLVFYSPSREGTCDVLFSADSDFSFGQNLPPLRKNSIVTSPHHGSDSNRAAYTKLNKQQKSLSNVIMVRSDGNYKSRPGSSYRSSDTMNICTLCRHSLSNKQHVILNSTALGWKKSNNVAWCHCK